IEKAIHVIPEPDAIIAPVVHRVRDVNEVLPELAGHVFIGRIFTGKFESDGEKIECIHSHPTGAIGLLEVTPGGQWRAAIEHTDVVQAQEAALEDVHSISVLAVYPPGEVEQ